MSRTEVVTLPRTPRNGSPSDGERSPGYSPTSSPEKPRSPTTQADEIPLDLNESEISEENLKKEAFELIKTAIAENNKSKFEELLSQKIFVQTTFPPTIKENTETRHIIRNTKTISTRKCLFSDDERKAFEKMWTDNIFQRSNLFNNVKKEFEEIYQNSLATFAEESKYSAEAVWLENWKNRVNQALLSNTADEFNALKKEKENKTLSEKNHKVYLIFIVSIKDKVAELNVRDQLSRDKANELEISKNQHDLELEKLKENALWEDAQRMMTHFLSVSQIDEFDAAKEKIAEQLSFPDNKESLKNFLEENKCRIEFLRKEKILLQEYKFEGETIASEVENQRSTEFEKIVLKEIENALDRNDFERLKNATKAAKFCFAFLPENQQNTINQLISSFDNESFIASIKDYFREKNTIAKTPWLKNAANSVFQSDFEKVKKYFLDPKTDVNKIKNNFSHLTEKLRVLRVSADLIKPNLHFCKTDSQRERLLIAKYRETVKKSELYYLQDKYKVEDKKPETESEKKFLLQKKLEALKAELTSREKIYITRKEPGSEKEYTWVPFWRDSERSSATAKLKNTRAMLTQIENLKKALDGKWIGCDGSAVTSKAAEDGELGKLFVKLAKLKTDPAFQIPVPDVSKMTMVR